MSSFAEQACFPAFTLRRFVILSCAIEVELFLQESLPSFAYICHFIAFVWPVVSTVTINTRPQMRLDLMGIIHS